MSNLDISKIGELETESLEGEISTATLLSGELLERGPQGPPGPKGDPGDPSMFSESRKLKDYLYEVYYNNIDYEYAIEKFKEETIDEFAAGCSSVRYDKYLGRNLDWFYDNNVEFIVRTPRVNNRFATIGVASTINGLTKEFVESKEYSELYKILPFRLVDGINEYGVAIETNVVPSGDKGINEKTVPDIEEREEICGTMLVRYVLDNFKTAKEAAEYIRDYVSIYNSEKLLEIGYEAHYMIADKTETYLLELIKINNVSKNVITLMDKPYMTNFHLNGVTFNEDGSVYTPATKSQEHTAMATNHVTANAAGLERYNIINELYNNLRTQDDVLTLLDELKYTKAYTNITDVWYTEFVGNGLTPDSDPEDFADVLEQARTEYAQRSRDTAITWQTTHSTVYDLVNKSFKIIVQEDEEILDEVYITLSDRVFINGVELTDHTSSSDLHIEVPTKTSDLINDGDGTNPFLTEHQDISGKADLTYVNTQLAIKADIDDIPTKTSDLTNDSGYLTEHQDISGKADLTYVDTKLATKADVDDVPTKTSDLTNDSGFLTEHQDISGKADLSYVNTELAIKADIDDIPTKTSDLTNDSDFADKEFVNHSIVTNTAHFRGTFESEEELQAYAGEKNNNDYAFVETTDAQGNKSFNRYKYVDTNHSWVFEYALSNSSFTAAQWASINSTITSSKVATYDAYATEKADVDDIPTKTSDLTNDSGFLTEHQSLAAYRTSAAQDIIDSGKQETLVSGTNIKTINNESILGSGNINIQGGGTSDFNELENRPMYDNQYMTGYTYIPRVPTNTSELINDAGYTTHAYVDNQLSLKQNELISGSNIKTINNESILGSGNIDISTSEATWGNISGDLDDQTDLSDALQTIDEKADYANSIAKQCNKAKGYINYQTLINELNSGEIGKNIFNPDVSNFEECSDTHVEPYGNGIQVSGIWYVKYYLTLKPNTTYAFTTKWEGTGYKYWSIYKTHTISDSNRIAHSAGTSGSIVEKVFTTDATETEYMMLFYGGDSNAGTVTYTNIQLEEGSSITEYEPFEIDPYYTIGQSFLIQTLNVPDLWVYGTSYQSVEYTYTTDDQFITDTARTGGCQVGFYKLCQLETLKQDLTNYVENTDYATSSNPGLVQVDDYFGSAMANDEKRIKGTIKSYEEYNNSTSTSTSAFISKGTLENVLTGKGLVPVSGTNDGDNWSTLTINGTTKNIPVGGGASKVYILNEDNTLEDNIAIAQEWWDSHEHPENMRPQFTNDYLENYCDLFIVRTGSGSAVGKRRLQQAARGYTVNNGPYIIEIEAIKNPVMTKAGNNLYADFEQYDYCRIVFSDYYMTTISNVAFGTTSVSGDNYFYIYNQQSTATNVVYSSNYIENNYSKTWDGTLAEYNAITTKDPMTVYLIHD